MILVALEQIAFSARTADVRSGLEKLQRSLRASIDQRPKSRNQEAFDAHLFARGMFEVCADIVNKGRRKKMLDTNIQHRVTTFIASRLNHRGIVPCEFSYRAIVEKTGSGRLELLGVKATDARALIAYGLWIEASRISLVQWRRYKTLKCRACGQNFRDLRDHMGGVIRTTCNDCGSADRHKNRGSR
jgi:hypothetical protein